MPVRTVIRKRSHKAQEGPRLREAPSHLHHPCRLSQVSVEDFGLVEDLVDWDAHNSPRSPNLPRSSGGGTHQSTLVHHRSRKPQSLACAGPGHVPRAARSLTWLLAGRLALVTRVEANPITSTASANQGARIVGLVTL
jgi:hypothetical protein